MKSLIKTILYTFLILLIVCALSLIVILEPKIKINGFMELDENRLKTITSTICIQDENGNEIDGKIYDNDKIYLNPSELPSYTSQAFVAVEDKRFYEHNGVDYIRILSAIKNNAISGSFKEGASTITQQLIKNTHLKNEKTLTRKIQEIRIARELERSYSKDDILSLYLNMLYFGENTYGIGKAAQHFFAKNANELTISESALLAGIINNPTRYSPKTNYENALKRRNLVLGRMLEQDYITKAEYDTAINENIEIKDTHSSHDNYLNSIIKELSAETDLSEDTVYGKNYTVVSYYNAELQNFIEKTISDFRNESTIISVIVADNEKSSVIASASDADEDLSHIKRSPGSTIKPILCYVPALERKGVYPCTPILDEKTSFNGWTPSNYNDRYHGWTDLETSLIKSLNIPAIKLLESNGIENSKRKAKLFGIRFNKDDDSLSLALGNMVEGVSLNDLCNAYGVFANQGVFNRNKYIKKIVDKNGNIVYERKNENRKAIEPSVAYLITDMLKKCVTKGTAKQLSYANLPVAAKTGTVGTKEGNTDAYCIAYTPHYTVAVWFGAKNGLMENKFSGGTVPTKIARLIIERLNDTSNFPRPDDIISADIDEFERRTNHKVLLAGQSIPLKNRKSVLFSKTNKPREYSTPSTYIEDKSILDDFDNFEISNSFVD